MKTEKIVYIPEVISSSEYSDRRKQRINKQAAAVAATLLALSATGQDRVDINRTYISSKEGLRDRTTYLVAARPKQKQQPKQAAIYTISKNGKSLSLKENADGTFSVTKEEPDIKMMAPIIGLSLVLTSFSLTLASLLNLNDRFNKTLKKLAYKQVENDNLKQENNTLKQQLKSEREKFADFRDMHPGLGVMSEKRMRQLKQEVLSHDFLSGLSGDKDGRDQRI